MINTRAFRGYYVTGLCILLFSAGCGSNTGQNSPGHVVNIDDPAEVMNSTLADGPFGETYALATAPHKQVAVYGEIRSSGEIITYEIGELHVGDQLSVEVVSCTDGFDPAAAVFNANQECIYFSDDRNRNAGRINPYIRFTSHKYTDSCMIAISSSLQSDSIGKYQLQVTRSPGPKVDEPTGQTIYLEFEGRDNVAIGSRAPVDVPPFSGSMIDPQFEPYTEDLIDLVVKHVRRNFADFNVTIIGSRDRQPPSSPHTTIFFGSYSSSYLGLADEIDEYNEDKSQNAIIFVDTFAAFMSCDPTLEEISNALSSVSSHEAGHLMGLYHTDDPLGIMDTKGSLRHMLLPRTFNRSPLSSRDVFPAGYQNAPALLLQTVGGSGTAVLSPKASRIQSYDPWYDEGPSREGLIFSTSDLTH